MKKTLNKVLLLFISMLVLSACQNEDSPAPEIKEKDSFVGLEDITQLVSQIQLPVEDTKGTKVFKNKEISNIMPVEGKADNKASFYVVNYEDGGFIVMSADNRINPVLAYSDSGELPLYEELPSGLVGWMEETSEYVDEVKASDMEQNGNVADAWKPQAIQRLIGGGDNEGIDRNEDGCQNTEKIVLPLTSTVWGQWSGYNDLVNSNIYCSKSSNGKPPAGCVAIALAQIMRYHKYPQTYNWSSMPYEKGINETARLIRDIGIAVGMDYGCDGSSAKNTAAVNALRNTFKYSSAIASDFDIDKVVAELNAKRPVYLSGGSKDYFIIFPHYENGHAWVCDGYKRYWDCQYDRYGSFNGTVIMTTYLRMNWGWSNKYLNGWFGYNDWKVDGSDYTYKKKMIYNIKP